MLRALVAVLCLAAGAAVAQPVLPPQPPQDHAVAVLSGELTSTYSKLLDALITVRRQQDRIADLERQNAELRKAAEAAKKPDQ